MQSVLIGPISAPALVLMLAELVLAFSRQLVELRLIAFLTSNGARLIITAAARVFR